MRVVAEESEATQARGRYEPSEERGRVIVPTRDEFVRLAADHDVVPVDRCRIVLSCRISRTYRGIPGPGLHEARAAKPRTPTPRENPRRQHKLFNANHFRRWPRLGSAAEGGVGNPPADFKVPEPVSLARLLSLTQVMRTGNTRS